MDEKNKSNTIGRIVKTLLLGALFAFLFIQASYFFRPASQSGIVSYYSEPEDSLDVVYIGGSNCFTYWAPMEAWNNYGFTSYDFANNTIPPQTLKYCIEEVLKTQNPKVLILDIRAFIYGPNENDDGVKYMYSEPRIRNFTDTFKYSINRFNMVNATVSPDESRWAYHFDLAKYHTNSAAFGGNRISYAPSYSKGFVLLERHQPIALEDMSGETKILPLAAEVMPVFEELLDYCAGLEQEILFITVPYVLSDEEQWYYNYMEQEIQAAGLTFLNANSHYAEIGFDEATDFCDESHTNIFGAEKYTAWLSNWLMQRYAFENKRQDPRYGQWNEGYTHWAADRDKTKLAVLELIENPPENDADATET